jgi:hypothetical protein
MSEGLMSRVQDAAARSVEGQKPSWKNTLTRAVAGNRLGGEESNGVTTDTEVEDKTDYTKSQKGESLPTTEAEYRPWIRAGILSQVKDGDFQGINPNAHGGLRDDLVAWTYRGENTPTDQEIVDFMSELLAISPANLKDGHEGKFAYFWSEAKDIKKRAGDRLSGKSQY